MASRKSAKQRPSAPLVDKPSLNTSMRDVPPTQPNRGYYDQLREGEDMMDDADLRRVGTTLETLRSQCSELYKQVPKFWEAHRQQGSQTAKGSWMASLHCQWTSLRR